MGEEVKRADFSRAQRREYRRKVQLCLDVFETMLAKSSFEFDRPLTGMEIECNLVDDEYQPAMSNQEVLASIADPSLARPANADILKAGEIDTRSRARSKRSGARPLTACAAPLWLNPGRVRYKMISARAEAERSIRSALAV